MCSLEDAWPQASEAPSHAPAAQSYARFSQAQPVKKPHGHYGCSGAYKEEPEPELDPQYVRPQRIREQMVVEPPMAPPVPLPPPQPMPAPPASQPMPPAPPAPQPMPPAPPAPCPCKRCRYGEKAKMEMQWWHWLLIVLGTALLAAFFVRLSMPPQRTIYRHVGIKV